MEIRRATRGDLSAIEAVAEASWQADYPEVFTRESAVEGAHEWYAQERMADELVQSDAVILVAEKDGEVVGFVHAAWTGNEGDVMRVYVDPDHRGRAVGSALLETAVATLFERDVERVRAMALAANEPGRAFYRSHGFEREDETYQTRIGGERYEEYGFVLER